jgi:prolycopene isomerase
MPETKLKSSYDIAIIGAGISGLTSSALLSRAGLSCCVLEMNPKAGGYIQGFHRGTFRFDTAIHWLNSCGPDGFVSRIFKMIGSDYPKAKEQKRIRRYLSDDFDYLLTNSPEELKNQWLKEFPEDQKGIQAFFAEARKIATSFDSHRYLTRTSDTKNILEKFFHALQMFKFIMPFIPLVKYTGKKGVKKGLKKYFKSPKLQAVFSSEPDLLSCLIPFSFAYLKDFQTPPQGGSQSYIEWLEYISQSLGSTISYKSKVDQIEIENQEVKALTFIRDGKKQMLSCKYIIAACDLKSVYEEMLPKNSISQKLKDKIQKANIYDSAFIVSIALDCPTENLGIGEETIYMADSYLERKILQSGDPHQSGIQILGSSIRDKSLALAEQGTLSLFIPGKIDAFEHWACERDENGKFIRGKAYKELKNQIADILIDRVQEKLMPNLREHIVGVDIATPITLNRYTANRDGSMMGQKPGKENMQAKVVGYKTPIKNLYIGGHWADLGGGVPIAVKSALNASLIVLKKENKAAFRLMSRYIDGKLQENSIYTSEILRPYSNSWIQELTPAQKAVK